MAPGGIPAETARANCGMHSAAIEGVPPGPRKAEVL